MFATKPLDMRLCATLLSGATLLLGPAAAQTPATPPAKTSAARQAAAPAAPLFGGTREKLVVYAGVGLLQSSGATGVPQLPSGDQ